MMTGNSDSVDHYTMSFGDHLEELRKRLMLALAAPIPLSFVTFFFSDTLLQVLTRPLIVVLKFNDLPTRLQALSPPEALITKIKISLIVAVIISFPWIVYQLWMFIRPGLYQKERRFVRFLIPFSTILTASGVSLLYFLMLPLMLQVLVSVGASMALVPPDEEAKAVLEAHTDPVPNFVQQPEEPEAGDAWVKIPEGWTYVALPNEDGPPIVRRVDSPGNSGVDNFFRLSMYIDFVLLLFLGIVIAFQMPLVVLLLGWMGLVSPAWLKKNRKYALFVCALVSAIITPADVISMVAMLLPLYFLYELGILMLRIAPAKAVAEGRVLKTAVRAATGAADKRGGPTTQTVKPAQPDTTLPRSPRPDESSGRSPDQESEE